MTRSSFESGHADSESRIGQAAPYLLLHLQYHLIIAFLTQESMAGDEAELAKLVDASLELQKINRDLYRNAIKSITDTLTFVKLIYHTPLLTTIYLNQAFFHAACAYSRDMVHGRPPVPGNAAVTGLQKEDLSPSAFPIPSQTSPSMMFYFDENSEDLRCPASRNGSEAATESTYSYLSLIAKANYQFLRQAIKDQAQFYAGSGWVDAVLDQRETGLRDVDLSIVSDSISTFIRLHDLREPGGSTNALKKVCEIDKTWATSRSHGRVLSMAHFVSGFALANLCKWSQLWLALVHMTLLAWHGLSFSSLSHQNSRFLRSP